MFKQLIRFYKYIILVLGLLIIPGFLLTFSVNVKAQGLPVFVDNDSFTSVYGYSGSEFINVCNSSRYFQNNGISIDIDTPGLIMFNGVENGYNYTEIMVPTTSYSGDFSTSGGVTYDTWNSDDNFLTLSSTYFYYFLYERGELWQAQLYYYGSGTQNLSVSFYGSYNDIGYLSSNYNWSVDPSKIIATNEAIPVINTGHATAPDEFESPVYPSGHAKPNQVPSSPTINNYSWTTYNNPSIDTTNLESLVESLIDVVIYNFSYLFTNLAGLFSNLISNIGSFIGYIGQLLEYYGNLIISNIQNGINTFYDNMVSLFEPISDTLNTIGVIAVSIVALGTEDGQFAMGTLIENLFLPNPAEVVALFYANDDFDILSTTIDVITTVPGLFNTLIGTLPSPKFHIPSLIYHGQQIGDFDIDFSWYAAYKVYVDIILNAFLIVGYIYWIFTTFGSHLRGHFMDYAPNDPENNQRLFRG